jgi:energy-coupling factor transporter transmembrane protein EcfT
MNRQKINLASATVCIAMSLLAFLLVILVVATGWERRLKDEGAAAHIFQLLIACQLPFILVFLATADWRRLKTVIPPIVMETSALALALGTVAFLRL